MLRLWKSIYGSIYVLLRLWNIYLRINLCSAPSVVYLSTDQFMFCYDCGISIYGSIYALLRLWNIYPWINICSATIVEYLSMDQYMLCSVCCLSIHGSIYALLRLLFIYLHGLKKFCSVCDIYPCISECLVCNDPFSWSVLQQ